MKTIDSNAQKQNSFLFKEHDFLFICFLLQGFAPAEEANSNRIVFESIPTKKQTH